MWSAGEIKNIQITEVIPNNNFIGDLASILD